MLTSPPQGAVLDQLAGDVHTLERKAATGTGAAQNRPSPILPQKAGDGKPDGQDEVLREGITNMLSEASQEDRTVVREGDCRDEHVHHQNARTGCENVHAAREGLHDEPSEHDGTGRSRSDNNQKGTDSQPVGGGSSGALVSSASTNYQQGGEPVKIILLDGSEIPSAASPSHLTPPKQAALELPLQPSPAVVEKEEEHAENAQLRFDLREARKLAEAYRRKFAAARKT